MDAPDCLRCRHRTSAQARYCATCGCPVIRDKSGPVAPRPSSGGTVLAWTLFVALLLVTLRPQEVQRPGGLVYSPTCQGTRGLIIDFPPDYPPSYFTYTSEVERRTPD